MPELFSLERLRLMACEIQAVAWSIPEGYRAVTSSLPVFEPASTTHDKLPKRAALLIP